jgi:hypothetical protein
MCPPAATLHLKKVNSKKPDENQHSVPKFLLQNFSVPLKPAQVMVFDKQDERTFAANISKISCERAYYDIEVGELLLSMERSLQNIGSTTSKIIRSVIETEQLPGPDSTERFLLSLFTAVQFLRVPNVRGNISSWNELLKQKLCSIRAQDADVERLTSMRKDEAKLISMGLLGKVSEFVPFFYYKTWMLYKTSKQTPFFIADNPVTLQNQREAEFPYGNLGVAVEGIEIYMPLSDQLSLGILCPTHDVEIHKLNQKFSAEWRRRPEVLAKLGNRATYLDDLVEGVTTGRAVPIPPEVVLNLNSLQAYFSSRFVYCTHDCFDPVREMIRKNPLVKAGPQYSAL